MEGARLGPYQILAELGSGGMGKVYRAEVAREAGGLEVGMDVALKVIHAHLLEQEGFFQRFLREADIGRSVRHENVVRTYMADALLHEGVQRNFLVMEYVEGQTLRELLRELERVPEELCRHIGREVAKGLAAIHAAGVVHRDIKPENVLITPEHVVKVMDLGVARLQDEAVRLSQAGAFVGSLEYAAPEQVRSAEGQPDGRADLHALGVVLYELAAGQHPYRDEDASKVLRNILDVTPRKAGEVNPQLSPFFEELLQTLIAKDPARRFADAPTLARVLEEGEEGAWWKERARALRLETKRPLRRIRIPRETALYGRDQDLARLQSLYDRAKGGDGQVLLIEGEAGIGKTRLVDEFVGRLRQEGEDLNFLFGSYPPGGAATASGAFSTAYREQFGPEGSRDYLPQTPLLVPAFDALLRGDATPTGAEPLTKDSLQTVFVHATRGLAAERPTIVLIDDLHFAPEDGRALFASLALAVPGHRVLLLGTMRPGLAADWLASVEWLEQAGRMALSRLGPKDLSALLEDAFRSERLADELGWRIAQKSDGNPFFAFEIIRGLREGQFISQRPDGSWVTSRLIEDIQVPSSIVDLVNARVADLTQEERDLLDIASCCGFEFDPLLVGELLGVGRIPLLKRLGQIERQHRLVRSTGLRYVFDHHQVQEALYGSLSELLRREYHAAIAEALEARAGVAGKDPEDLDGTLCADLCEHYLRGGRGEAGLRYQAPAVRHLLRSAMVAQALDLLDRALDEPGLVQGSQRVHMLLHAGGLLDLLGRRDAQEERTREALSLADECDDDRLRFHATWALAYYLLNVSRNREAGPVIRRMLDLEGRIGDPSIEVDAFACLAWFCRSEGQFEEALEHARRALAPCRQLGDQPREAMVLNTLSLLLQNLGRHEEARQHFLRSLEIARLAGSRVGEAVATGNVGLCLLKQGRLDEAQPLLERHLAQTSEIGVRQLHSYARHNLAELLVERNEVSSAIALFEEALAIKLEIRDARAAAHTRLVLGALLAAEGEAERGRALLEASAEDSRKGGFVNYRTLALCELAALTGQGSAQALAALTEHASRLHADQRRIARFLLWKATGDRAQLEQAKQLLDRELASVPEEHRDAMRSGLRVNREITRAWKEHVDKAGSEGAAH